MQLAPPPAPADSIETAQETTNPATEKITLEFSGAVGAVSKVKALSFFVDIFQNHYYTT
jgi:hypothetical protein